MGKKGIPGGNPKSRPFWVLPLANAACAGRCQEGWVLCGPTACPLSPWPARGGEGSLLNLRGDSWHLGSGRDGAPGACMHRVGRPSRGVGAPPGPAWRLFRRSQGALSGQASLLISQRVHSSLAASWRQQLSTACLPPSTSPVFGHV